MFHEITEFFSKLSIEVLWNSFWPLSDSCSSSEDSDTSSSSLSLSALLSSWLLALFPRRLSPQCTVVGLKIRKILQLNLSTTAIWGTEGSGCSIDFLEVLRFSFPVPVVSPARRTFIPCSEPIYRRNFPPVGFIQSRTFLLMRRQSNPITSHETWLELWPIFNWTVYFLRAVVRLKQESVYGFFCPPGRKKGAVVERWPFWRVSR